MKMIIAPLFSGSSGNCVYVGTEENAVLVDAGVSATAILTEMAKVGLDASLVRALLITHEHTDHTNGAGPLARKLDVPVYATQGTMDGCRRKLGKLNPARMCTVQTGADFYVGGIDILPFPTSHDCVDPCGYSFSAGGIRVSVLTDTGCVKTEALDAVKGSDAVLLESNYNPDMLMAGPYPYELKKRIMGRRGHLSNEDAGAMAVKLYESGTRTVILGHLSKENNFPELALQTSTDILAENGILCGRDLNLSVARREGGNGVYTIESR